MTSGIYEIRNIQNGHQYIGSSANIARRWKLHKNQLNRECHHSLHLQSAWNKYGGENFSFVVLEKCNPEILLDREQYYFDTQSPEYNHCIVAGNPRGIKRSDETRMKLGLSHIGFHPTLETRAKMLGNTNASGKRTEETRQRISEAKKGRGLGNANAKGKHWKQTPEHSAKIGATKIGNSYGRGHVVTDEHKAKIVEANKRRWARWRIENARD